MTTKTIMSDTGLTINDFTVERDWSDASRVRLISVDHDVYTFNSMSDAAAFLGTDTSEFNVIDHHRGYINRSIHSLSVRDEDDRLTLEGVAGGEFDCVRRQFTSLIALVKYSLRNDI